METSSWISFGAVLFSSVFVGLSSSAAPPPAVTINPFFNCHQSGSQNTAVLYADTGNGEAALARMSPEAAVNTLTSDNGFAGYLRAQSSSVTSFNATTFPKVFIDEDKICRAEDKLDVLVGEVLKKQPSSAHLERFNRFVVIYPQLSCLAALYGTLGCRDVKTKNGTVYASVLWAPMQTYSSNYNGLSGKDLTEVIGIWTHEGGHNLANDHQFMEYFDGEPLGRVGKKGKIVDSNRSPFTPLGSGPGQVFYSAPQLHHMGWAAKDGMTMEVNSTKTIQLYARSFEGKKAKILKVRRGNEWIWLEYRQPTGRFESAFRNEAYCIRTDGAVAYTSRGTQIDFSPGQIAQPESGCRPYNEMRDSYDSVLRGRWQDRYTNLTLEIVSRNRDFLTVKIVYR